MEPADKIWLTLTVTNLNISSFMWYAKIWKSS